MYKQRLRVKLDSHQSATPAPRVLKPPQRSVVSPDAHCSLSLRSEVGDLVFPAMLALVNILTREGRWFERGGERSHLCQTREAIINWRRWTVAPTISHRYCSPLFLPQMASHPFTALQPWNPNWTWPQWTWYCRATAGELFFVQAVIRAIKCNIPISL